MRGELIAVWSESWREIWLPLVDLPLGESSNGPPVDMFCELYRALNWALIEQHTVEQLAEIIDDPGQSREAFEAVTAADLAGERALVSFFETAHDVLEDIGGDELSNRYFNLTAKFVEKFSLRYDLRRPCVLFPTLPGIFNSLVRELQDITNQDAHLDGLMKDFEAALRDLRQDFSDHRIRTCIHKQMNLLEGIGRTAPGVTSTTLGSICNEIRTWPHETVKVALKSLFGFASNYPGIRHSGNPTSSMRAIDMRDMVAMSIVLTGFTPYLESRLNSEAIFGSTNLMGATPPPKGSAQKTTPLPKVLRIPGFFERFAFWKRNR